MKDNNEILQTRVAALNRRKGPRVGDYLRLPLADPRCGEFTRFTHDWDDSIQTGGMGGSFYFTSDGYCSYSGSLDSGIATADILPTDETREGPIWFFDGDISGAGRGVNFNVLFKVFAVRPGANLDGIGELRCPFGLCICTPEQTKQHGYWATIHKHAYNHTAFKTEPELMRWLESERVVLSKPLNGAGWYRLDYPTPK